MHEQTTQPWCSEIKIDIFLLLKSTINIENTSGPRDYVLLCSGKLMDRTQTERSPLVSSSRGKGIYAACVIEDSLLTCSYYALSVIEDSCSYYALSGGAPSAPPPPYTARPEESQLYRHQLPCSPALPAAYPPPYAAGQAPQVPMPQTRYIVRVCCSTMYSN